MGYSNQIEGIIQAKKQLVEILTEAANAAQQSGKIPVITLPEITLERTQNADHGDYASSFPLKLARAARTNPMTIANDLVKSMSAAASIADISIAPPGFINFTLKPSWLASQVNTILTQ